MRARPLLIGLVLAVAGVAAALAVVTQPLVAAVESRPPAVDAARLEAHVRTLSTDFHPRSHDQRRGLDAAAEYVRAQFQAAGARTSVQEFLVEGEPHRNVVARFGPAAGPLLVVGAHYDSDGNADRGAAFPGGFSPQTHTPGADDNASGVAALLELARLLVRFPPGRPVELVAFTLEESPHFGSPAMGSAVHAQALQAAGREVALMISLEMLGYFSDAPGSQGYPYPGMEHLYSPTGNFIALAGRLADFGTMRRVKALMRGATELPVHSINAPPALPGLDLSDHRSYWEAGFPALMVTDTAFYRNPNYHRATDTFDTLDYARMAQVVQGVFAVIQGL